MEAQEITQQSRLQNELRQTRTRLKQTSSPDRLIPHLGLHNIRALRWTVCPRGGWTGRKWTAQQTIRSTVRLPGRRKQPDTTRRRTCVSPVLIGDCRTLHDVNEHSKCLSSQQSLWTLGIRSHNGIHIHLGGLLRPNRQDRASVPLNPI